MIRLLSLLVALALVLTNGTAAALTTCQHPDASAHALALQSSDSEVAAEAHHEEVAAMQKSTLAHAAAMQMAPFLLPPEPVVPAPQEMEPVNGFATDGARLANRAIRPLLEPPIV